ncbi:uncharacterized protein N7469_002250 [Penicillium citrinum]|uniref:Uncharacterized protein n=1 Tax=Penicillium citrinum TaxID=5077 RepID=A0A9W9PA29_PENCI|nr:uncharacterized protein N7469_002250 [Penicillium citrinum]KAJ5240659.1 hypothetical protein N7469_002250 [Penicillium citrinum]
MAEPASESSVPKPDDFHSQLLELLEDESSTEESSCGKEAISRRHRSSTAKKMIKNGKRADRDDESVNRDEKGTVSKPWRKMEAIDSSSSRLHRRHRRSIEVFEALPGTLPGGERHMLNIGSSKPCNGASSFALFDSSTDGFHCNLWRLAGRAPRRWNFIVFEFVTKHRSRISCEGVWKNVESLQDLRDLVASIRHAAVHRLPQDRDSLLQMNRAAVKFCLCVGDGPETERLCRLFWFLQKILPKSGVAPIPTEQRQSQQIQQVTPAPHKRRNTRPSEYSDGMAKLIGCVEMVFVAEVDRFLQTELL